MNQTTKTMAIEIYKALLNNVAPEMLRKVAINQFVQELGMTKGGASTYYANMKKGTWSLTVEPVEEKFVPKFCFEIKPKAKRVPKSVKFQPKPFVEFHPVVIQSKTGRDSKGRFVRLG